MSQRNLFVIGGTSGIGAAIVEHFAPQADYQLFVQSRNAPENPVQGVQYYTGDMLKEELPADLPEELHGLVYAPGSITLKPINSLKPEQFRSDYEVNVIGAVNALRALYKPMRKSGDCSVVLFSTVAVKVGMPFHASVAAAKAGVEGLGKSLAAEWAQHGIRVNVVAPSLTDTPMASNLLKIDKQRESSAKRHPIERVGTPEDMAQAAAYLLTPASSWMTGQVLHVDGGMSSLRLL